MGGHSSGIPLPFGVRDEAVTACLTSPSPGLPAHLCLPCFRWGLGMVSLPLPPPNPLQVWAWLAFPVSSFSLVLSLDASPRERSESLPACPSHLQHGHAHSAHSHVASGCGTLLWTLHGLLLAQAASLPTPLPPGTQPCVSPSPDAVL